jgi:hypothetical protein
MPEQSVLHREETDSDQQTILLKIKGEMNDENNRQYCTARIQCCLERAVFIELCGNAA